MLGTGRNVCQLERRWKITLYEKYVVTTHFYTFFTMLHCHLRISNVHKPNTWQEKWKRRIIFKYEITARIVITISVENHSYIQFEIVCCPYYVLSMRKYHN